jgi:hypothetical protein
MLGAPGARASKNALFKGSNSSLSPNTLAVIIILAIVIMSLLKSLLQH